MNVDNFKNHCCGCLECVSVCPVNAIKYEYNKQGFLYPLVDSSLCVNCGKCVKRCSFNNTVNLDDKYKTPIAYAVKHKDENVRANSRSGGVFTAITDYVLGLGGAVYGCVLENNTKAIHIRATTKQERDKMRGSKYIQSETFNVFESVKNDLINGLYVLFSGTSCQVNAIKDYCKDVNNEKLFLLDIVCHGVPSPKVWFDYLKFLGKENKSKITFADFRDKKNFGWADHKETVVFDSGVQYSKGIFTKLFYSHLILRKDCFNCPYKNVIHPSNITIGDCWGIAKNKEFDDDKGVSLVLINDEKGKFLFSNCENLETLSIDVNDFLQPPLRTNWKFPNGYDEFWKFYNKNKFSKVIKKYVNPKKESLFARIKSKVKSVLKKLWRRKTIKKT